MLIHVKTASANFRWHRVQRISCFAICKAFAYLLGFLRLVPGGEPQPARSVLCGLGLASDVAASGARRSSFSA